MPLAPPLPGRRPGPLAVDLAVTAAATLATALPPLLAGERRPWIMALCLLASAPLYWRRRAPIAVAGAVGAAVTALALLGEAPALPYGPLVATYTFASLSSAPWRVAGAVVTALGVAVSLAVPREDPQLIRYLTVAYVAAYALGTGARARRAQVAAVEERSRRLVEERAAAAARERARIAREMHDIVTHAVGIMVVQAEAGPLVLRSEPERAAAVFEAIAATGRTAVAQLRRSVATLRAAGDADGRGPAPGIAALPDLIDQVTATGLDVSLEGHEPHPGVPADVDLAAYRIVQESLTNAMRHASARHVWVRLSWSEAMLGIEVRDDGRGPARGGPGGAGDGAEPGFGLIGMRERASACGGELSAGPAPEGPGFAVTASLPIE